ncbi:MAG: hypothetical protein MZV70_34050 [Desulfobacterales bacterium]|nr:hypothetical protein [Desulfobacterales bacterium]
MVRVTEARVENHGGTAFPAAVEVEAPRTVDRDQPLRLRVGGVVDDYNAPCAIAGRGRGNRCAGGEADMAPAGHRQGYLPYLAWIELRILDEPEPVAEGILHGANPDAAADILHGLQRYRPAGEQSLQRCIGIGDAPQRLRPVGTRCPIGHQPQFESPHFEADVKRLVEVRRVPTTCVYHAFAATRSVTG